MLNKYYSNNRLKELPIYFHLITHKEKKYTFKTVKTHKIITISEISFCMFELDNNRTGYCKLVFFADLKDLIGTKLDSKKQEIEIKFKNLENDKKIHKIEIMSPNSEKINQILLDNQKAFLSYSNNNSNDKNKNDVKNLNPSDNTKNNNSDNKNDIKENNNQNLNDLNRKEQKNETNDKNDNKTNPNMPNINIAMVEKQIIYVEKSLNVGEKPNKEQIDYLI